MLQLAQMILKIAIGLVSQTNKKKTKSKKAIIRLVSRKFCLKPFLLRRI